LANTEQIEDRVRTQLERWGYSVEPIQVAADARRADFVATVDDERIVIEVTSKNDDGQYDRDLRNFGEALQKRRIERTGTLDRTLRGKNDQLRSTPEAVDAIRIVWIEAVGPFRETIAHQIQATFYGQVSVPVSETDTVPCYFFDYASCYSLLWIDAVIVSLDVAGCLLVNPWSSGNPHKLRTTRIARIFESGGGFVSPLEEEQAGRSFSAHDFQGDRRDERAKCLFLEGKYGIRPFISLRFKVATAAKQIDSPRRRVDSMVDTQGSYLLFLDILGFEQWSTSGRHG
jgi:hypothetical protein